MRTTIIAVAMTGLVWAAPVAGQGTGQGGCYFGQGPGCANPTPPASPAPQPQPQPPSSTRSFHYVDDTRPPDAYLALRTQPGGSSGSRIMEMTNGTLLQVLEQRPDGWWRVRVMPAGPEGWALNRQRDRVWIHCCRQR